MNESVVTAEPPSARPRLAGALSWLVIAAPFLLFALALPHVGALQRNDYWGDFRGVLEPDGTLSTNPMHWIAARSNEHFIGLQLVVWYLNAIFTHGDNRGLAVVSFVYLLAAFAILYRQLPESVRSHPLSRSLHAFPIAALLATPAAAHNWVMGFSGNQWYLVNLFAIAALARLTRPVRRLRDLWSIALLLALAGVSHGTFLAIGPALLVGSLLLPVPGRCRLALLAVVTSVSLLYAAGYHRPPNHPPTQRNPLVLAAGVLEYIGSAGTESVGRARALGGVGLLLWAGGGISLLHRRRTGRSLPATIWWLLALFALSCAFGTSVGRSGSGPSFAATISRYASLPVLFWLGSGMTLLLTARAEPGARRASRVPVLVAVAMFGGILVPNYLLGIRRLDRHLVDIDRNSVVELAMRWNLWDHELESRIIHMLSAESRRFFERLRHKPFDIAIEGPRGTRRTERVRDADVAHLRGAWSDSTRIDDRWARVSGWVLPASVLERRVLFLDHDGIVRGAAVFVPETTAGIHRRFGELLSCRPRPSMKWIGYVPIEFLEQVQPVLESAGEPDLYALRTGNTSGPPRPGQGIPP